MRGSATAHAQTPADPPELSALYRAHAGFVWRVVQRMGVPEEAAEDVVQEVFLVVRRRLADYDGRASAKTWLYGIARRVTANFRRSRSRARQRLRVVGPPAAPEPPDQLLDRSRAVAMVEAFLAALDPDQRAVFELIDIEGLRGPEAATALGWPLSRVYSRLRLARKHFAKALRERQPTEAS